MPPVATGGVLRVEETSASLFGVGREAIDEDDDEDEDTEDEGIEKIHKPPEEFEVSISIIFF